MTDRFLDNEEFPLRTATTTVKRPRTLKGPLRVLRLCLLGITLPAFLLAIPLYLRYRVYGSQLYPLAMSDMRMIDNKVSTTWCQRQLVKTNATFNAFLLAETPKMAQTFQSLSMVRHLVLEQDTKEYWGFYLLKGSSVTVNTCVRWPGASLIVIRGHRHLHECAYIGDDSSEEIDELMEAIREGTYVAKEEEMDMIMKDGKITKIQQESNDPEEMKRHGPGVVFHGPNHAIDQKNTLPNQIDTTADVTDQKIMKTILEAIRQKQQEMKKDTKKEKEEKEHKHVHRNQTIAQGESKNFNIYGPNDVKNETSEEVVQKMLDKLHSLGLKGSKVLEGLNQKFKNMNKTVDTKNRYENNLKGVLQKFKNMNKTFDTKNSDSSVSKPEEHQLGHGRHYQKPVISYSADIDNEKSRRRKRDVQKRQAFLDLNRDDGENDQGVEEGFTPRPDGIADHRGTVNETNLNDMSNSEFWSSFSSSEEALLNCAGLILNLPLTPHHKCKEDLTEHEVTETSLDNSVTYRVPVNGYYFFIFNSENEVQPNYIRVNFHLNKAVYNVSNPVQACKNTSKSCAVNLKFFSSEKLVLELPLKENDTMWNEEYIVESECEPRTALYAVCVITVPVLVFLFAFS